MDIIDTNVLFVDAEVSVLESIRRMLLDENKKADFASSFDEAIKIINEKNIDTMVVDITANNLIELLVKVQESNPSIVKVVISDFSHLSKIINSIRKLNLHSFLLKPWKKSELFDTLTSAEDYSSFLKLQAKEKENLEQKNVIYQRIINFKDDIGTYNKVDINALKTSLFIQGAEYEKIINNNEIDKELAIKNINSASDMFSMAFPTFIEKFSVSELIESLNIDNVNISLNGDDTTYIKNLALVKELILRTNKFLTNSYSAKEVAINMYPEKNLCVRFDFKFDTCKKQSLDSFFLFLKSLIETLECSLDYELNDNGSNLTFIF